MLLHYFYGLDYSLVDVHLFPLSVLGVLERWLYLAAALWISCGFIDFWFILVLLKGEKFDRWSNRIHFAQSVGVWSLSGLMALIPVFAEGRGSYTNTFLTFSSFGTRRDLDYYFSTLPSQLALAPLELFLPHLVYTLRKRVYKDFYITCDILFYL